MEVTKRYNFKSGKELIVELISGYIIEGIVDQCGEHFIKFRKCTDHSTGLELNPMIVYRNQIVNIRTLEDSNSPNQSNNSELENHTSSASVSSTEECKTKTILLPKDEYNRLKKLTTSYIYMSILDSRYYEAVDVLKNTETIGLSGVGFNREHNLILLVMSTWDQVYIFDIQELNEPQLPLELREILKMSSLKKVTHNGRRLVCCLHNNYNVDVCNLFDTQVADLTIRKALETDKEEFHTLSLGEMLTGYLNFPENLLDKSEIVWSSRPLASPKRKAAAETAAYLITLRVTMEDILLKDFYAAVRKYTTSFNEHDNYDRTAKLTKQVVHTREFEA